MTITAVATADAEDPQDCADCVAVGDLCPFHAGVQVGWDACSALVGRYVVSGCADALNATEGGRT